MKGLGISAQKHSVPFVLSLSLETQNKTPNTHTMHALGSNHYFIPLTYIPFSCSPSDLCVLPLSSPLPSSRCDAGCRRCRDAQSDVDSGLIFFFFSFLFLYQKKGPHLQRRLHLNTEHKDRSKGDILFSDFITPRMLGVYSNSLSPDMHGEGCDYAPLSCSALI